MQFRNSLLIKKRNYSPHRRNEIKQANKKAGINRNLRLTYQESPVGTIYVHRDEYFGGATKVCPLPKTANAGTSLDYLADVGIRRKNVFVDKAEPPQKGFNNLRF